MAAPDDPMRRKIVAALASLPLLSAGQSALSDEVEQGVAAPVSPCFYRSLTPTNGEHTGCLVYRSIVAPTHVRYLLR
jgi:hypothetical protein